MAGEAIVQLVNVPLGKVETAHNQLVAVGEEQASVVTIGLQGPIGPVDSFRFQFQQTVPAALWTVNHNLGARPNVEVLSVGGVRMLAEVIHTNINQVLVYFDQPQSGLVICS